MWISLRRFRWMFLAFVTVSLFVVVACSNNTAKTSAQHNAIIFVADGLRFSSVNAEDMPTLSQIQQRGVKFVNSHSLFPTFTTANASAIATGHYLGDTGDFSNTISVGFKAKTANQTLVPFLENNAVINEVNQYHNGNYLNEESLLSIARKAGFSTAAIGKIGPVLIQDVTLKRGEPTIIIDDATGTTTGIALSDEVTAALKAKNLAVATPSRGDNGKPGTSTQSGTKQANTVQQKFFVDAATEVVLPLFKQRGKPFVMVYWSRDPDGTQHNHGDSLNKLTPGINGPTTQAARRNADQNLAQIQSTLDALGLTATTDIFVTSDHGFSTISKESKSSYAATLSYLDVPKDFLPPGFLAIDLARGLNLSIFDPDKNYARIDPSQGQFAKNAVIGKNPNQPDVIVAGNGGSDLIYVPDSKNRKATTQKIVAQLLNQDYVSGIFVDDALQPIPGALPFSAINLRGKARTPLPAIVVNFRSFDTGCGTPTLCGAEIADTGLQQGQGMHGSFSRADTYNTMAAIGPDFKTNFVDPAPVGNADVAVTLAKILNLKIPHRGDLIGRVLEEALVNSAQTIDFKTEQLESKPAKNGLKTILKSQSVGQTRYFDAAGFPGRTIGL